MLSPECEGLAGDKAAADPPDTARAAAVVPKTTAETVRRIARMPSFRVCTPCNRVVTARFISTPDADGGAEKRGTFRHFATHRSRGPLDGRAMFGAMSLGRRSSSWSSLRPRRRHLDRAHDKWDQVPWGLSIGCVAGARIGTKWPRSVGNRADRSEVPIPWNTGCRSPPGPHRAPGWLPSGGAGPPRTVEPGEPPGTDVE